MYYEIIYDYGSYKRYEEVRLQTTDRNEAVQYFLKLFVMKQNGSMILESDCRVSLRVEINCYIRDGVELFDCREEIDLNKTLDRIEKRLTTSYDTYKYSIKLGSGSEFMKKYETLFETENRCDALEKFLEFFNKKQRNIINGEDIPDIVLFVAISPFDERCLYLKFIEDESEILQKVSKCEKDLEYSFSL